MTTINRFKTFLTWNVNYLQFEPKKAKRLQMVTKHQRDRQEEATEMFTALDV